LRLLSNYGDELGENAGNPVEHKEALGGQLNKRSFFTAVLAYQLSTC